MTTPKLTQYQRGVMSGHEAGVDETRAKYESRIDELERDFLELMGYEDLSETRVAVKLKVSFTFDKLQTIVKNLRHK